MAQKGSALAIVILVDLNEYLHLAGTYFLHAQGITIPVSNFDPTHRTTTNVY